MRKEPPQLYGVAPPPGRRGAGDVRAATDGSFVPPGVSTDVPVAKECSKGFGSYARCGGATEAVGCPVEGKG